MVTQFLLSTHEIYCDAVRSLPVMLKSGEGTGTGISSITDAMVTGLTDIANQMMVSIGKILPAVLIVVGGIIVVTFGIKLFKKLAK